MKFHTHSSRMIWIIFNPWISFSTAIMTKDIFINKHSHYWFQILKDGCYSDHLFSNLHGKHSFCIALGHLTADMYRGLRRGGEERRGRERDTLDLIERNRYSHRQLTHPLPKYLQFKIYWTSSTCRVHPEVKSAPTAVTRCHWQPLLHSPKPCVLDKLVDLDLLISLTW